MTNVHFHTVVMDGVYAPDEDGNPRFYPAKRLYPSQVQQVTETIASRITAMIKRQVPSADDPDSPQSDPLWTDDPAMAAIYTASVTSRIATGPNLGQRVGLAGDRVDPESMEMWPEQLAGVADGFNLHAGVFVPPHDRARLERLLRYAARPPLATERLEELADGRLSYRFKTPWRNGTTHAVFSPLELLEKLTALVPSPRAHLTRFHGVLAPAARWRPLIVPGNNNNRAPGEEPQAEELPIEAAHDGTPQEEQTSETPSPDAKASARRRRNYTWSELLKRVFNHPTNCIVCRRTVRPCPDHPSVPPALWTGSRLRRPAPAMG